MHHDEITVGMKLMVKMPASGFDWLLLYNSWWYQLKSMEDKLVTVETAPVLGQTLIIMPGRAGPYYFVRMKENPSWFCAVDWLQLPTTTGSIIGKIPCDCPMLTIMTQGCKDVGHL